MTNNASSSVSGSDFKELDRLGCKSGLIEAGEHLITAVKGERESVHELVQRKREMFLSQLSLQAKQKETIRLEQEMKKREDDLHRKNEKLRQQSTELELLMQENDKKAVEAIKKASEEGRRKSEKVQELKRLQNQINQLKSEKSILEDQLTEYLECKSFLLSLTPPEWLEEQRNLLKEEGKEEIDDDDIPLYFNDPNQILEIFQNLEDRNLFLIQACQEREEELDVLKSSYSAEKDKNISHTTTMKLQVESLQSQVDQEERKLEELRKSLNQSNLVEGHDAHLQQIKQKINELHLVCNLGSQGNSGQVGSLRMLTDIEAFIDHLLAEISKIPVPQLKRAQKQQERDRREQYRAEMLEKQRQEKEKRIQDVLRRATEPIKKRTGKPVMFRSFVDKKEKTNLKDATQSVQSEDDLMQSSEYQDFWQ
ncbi:hypothetical protein RCL1_000051 [Eukaryota sp. TZLM3-RCL]